MLVSAMEKSPEITSRTASATNCTANRMSSKAGAQGQKGAEYSLDEAAPQDHLEHETAAHIGEQQRDKADERPAQRDPSPPAVEIAPGEERRKNKPGSYGEHRLVVEFHRPAEKRFRKRDSGRERQREEHESREDDLEQQLFHRQQGRQRGERPDRRSAVQPPLHQGHQKRVQRGDREHTVGDHREREVQPEFGRMRVRRTRKPREERRQRRANGGEREDRRLHALELEEAALDP